MRIRSWADLHIVEAGRAAYLALQVPTADTYLETAFLNPTSSNVTIDISIRRGNSWKLFSSISLGPKANRKVHVASNVLTDPTALSAAWAVLIKAEYSVSTTEIVSNAWLEDEKTGFSNTALLHDEYARSNALFATQLVSRSFPETVLQKSPVFDSSLVFVNVGDSSSDLSGSLFCDIDSTVTEIRLPVLHLQPFSPQVLAVESLVLARTTRPAVCSGRFEYSGEPGGVIGRYYAASQGKTFGLYVKLEPFVGRAYNEVYWSTQDDFVPLLSISNFAEEPDVISVFMTNAGTFVEVARETVAAHRTLTLNMRDKTAALYRDAQIRSDYGGMYIRTKKPDGKLMVKQHAISASRLMIAPYYGGFDYITEHYFSSVPALMPYGIYASASATTCYSSSGCYDNFFSIFSANSSILTVNNSYSPRWIYAQGVGTAALTSTATGTINDQGTFGEVDAMPVAVEVDCAVPTNFRQDTATDLVV